MDRAEPLRNQAVLERENAQLRDTVRALRDALDGMRNEFARRLADVEARTARHRGELESTIGELNRLLHAKGGRQ